MSDQVKCESCAEDEVLWDDMAEALEDTGLEIEALRSKLAKAVEALEQISKPKVGPDFDWSEEEVNAWKATWYRKYGDMARETLNQIGEGE